LYEAERSGEPAALEQPRPYRDYIAWLEVQDLSEVETFWRGRLAGFTAPTPLPAERTRTGDGGATEGQVLLPEPLTASLQELSRHRQVTLNTLVQGAWALLLARWSGEDDVIFGAVTAGRPTALPGVEKRVGLFVNTLPVRVRAAWTAPLLT